jgi:ribonuclease-3
MAVRDPLVAPVQGHHLSTPGQPVATDAAEAILGHEFARKALLREALTHRSAAHPQRGRGKGTGSNERLEFVGDRVLGLLIAEWLAERFPREQEGELGRRLAHLVSQPVLAVIAEETGLPAALAISPGESRAGVRRRATVLADAVEAAIGALFLDGGIEPARAFIRRAWEGAMSAQAAPPKDAKTALQEWAQGRGQPLPAYRVASREGPPHAPVFVIAVTVAGQTGTGTAGTKRAAEQDAATDLLGKLNK